MEAVVTLDGYVDLFMGFMAFNLAYFISHEFSNYFDGVHKKSIDLVQEKVASQIDFLGVSNMTDNHLNGCKGELDKAWVIFTSKTKKLIKLFSNSSHVKPYFLISALICLIFVIAAGYEGTFNSKYEGYNLIFYGNVIFLSVFWANFIQNLARKNKDATKRIIPRLVFLGISLLMILTLYFCFSSICLSEMKKISQFAINTSILVALSPYLGVLVIACYISIRNYFCSREALKVIREQQEFVSRLNKLK